MRTEWLVSAVKSGNRWPWASSKVIWETLFADHPNVDHERTYWLDVSRVNNEHAYRIREYLQSVGATRSVGLRYRYELRDLYRENQEFDTPDIGLESNRLSETEMRMFNMLVEDLSKGEEGVELVRLRAMGCAFAIIDRYTLRVSTERTLSFHHYWDSVTMRTALISPWVGTSINSVLGNGDWVQVESDGATVTDGPRFISESNAGEEAQSGSPTKKLVSDEIAAAMQAVWGDAMHLPDVEEGEFKAIEIELGVADELQAESDSEFVE